MNALQKKPKYSLADKVYACVKEMIFEFDLLPGSRFSELELCQKLEVSRTPLRQALQLLQQQGLVQVLPKMGWFVSPIDFDVMDELYDLRILLETHAIGLIVRQIDTPILKLLSDVWLVEPAMRETEAKIVGQLDERFHSSLVEAAGNQELLRVHNDITERIRLIRRLDFTVSNRVQATYEEHAKILIAILKRSKAEAQSLLKAHIEQSKLEVRKITLETLMRKRQS